MVHPGGMGMREWADATMYLLSGYSTVCTLLDDDWQSWGASITQSPKLARLDPPNPYEFDDWLEWAYKFNDSLVNIPQ